VLYQLSFPAALNVHMHGTVGVAASVAQAVVFNGAEVDE
jgi:hypothetical protein